VLSLRVIAATVETHGQHLAFLRADGRLAALVLAEIVEEWFELLASDPVDILGQETCLLISNIVKITLTCVIVKLTLTYVIVQITLDCVKI
jgi:hypothetical protein